MNLRRSIFFAAAPLFFGAFACGGSPSSSTDDSTASASEDIVSTTASPSYARLTPVRVVHASPDAPAVDVYVRGVASPIFEKVAYGDTTCTRRFVDGTYTIDLRASPSKASDPIAYSTGPLAVGGGSRITAIAAGLLSSSDPASAFRILPEVEGFAKPGAGKAAVRVVHAGADAPTVGLDIGNADPANPTVPALARFADTGAAGVALPANEAIQIGVDAGGERVTAFTTPELPANADLFVIATGLLADLPRQTTGFDLLVVGPDGTIGFLRQNPVVYALHASPDAPSVDVFAGSAKIVANLAFGGLSAPVQVPPGSYSLAFYGASSSATPTGAAAATESLPDLAAGERYLAIATGFLAPASGQPGFELLEKSDRFDLTDAANARVRVVHASPDAPAVDVGVASGQALTDVLVSDLSFTHTSSLAGLSVPAASLDIGVAASGSAATVATFGVTTTAGLRAFVVAAGALDASDGASFRLLAVDTSVSPWTVASILPH